MPILIGKGTYFIVWACFAYAIDLVPMQNRECFNGYVVGPLAHKPYFRMTADFLVDSEIGLNDDDQVWVIDRFDFLDQDLVIRWACEATSWHRFCRFHVTTQGGSSADREVKRPKPTDKVPDLLMAEFLWLTEADLQVKAMSRRTARVADKSFDGGSPGKAYALRTSDDDSDVDQRRSDDDDGEPDGDAAHPVEHAAKASDMADVDVDALGKELLSLRDEFADPDLADCLFYVSNRGGEWLHKTKRKPANEATSFARALAEPFCRKFGWARQKGFGYDKHLGILNSNMLAREYARRGHHYACIWIAHDSDRSFIFTEEHTPEEDLEFISWACKLAIHSVPFAAALAVRKAVPKNPAA